MACPAHDKLFQALAVVDILPHLKRKTESMSCIGSALDSGIARSVPELWFMIL
jgi:hypothetical protein